VFVDFRSPETPQDIQCDLCIIGAGAAGITLACALIDTGIQVCLLESGGLENAADIQALYEGDSVSLENASPIGCRLRYFGGTTNHWEGWCAPLRNIDFEPRPWVPNSGWPIRKADLAPYYERAQEICQIGYFDFTTDALQDTGLRFPEFAPDKAVTRHFQFSPPTRFGTVYRERLERAANVQVMLYANTIGLETDEPASEVRYVRLQTLQGRSGSVRARIVVLACGGMENARLLLLSNQVAHAGLGNSSGLVGQYFMQHIEGMVGRILASDPEKLERIYSKYVKEGVGVRAEISLSEQAQRKHRILDSGFTIDASVVRGAGYKSLRNLWVDLKQGRWPNNFSTKLQTVLTDLGSIGDAIYKQDQYDVQLYVRAEQSPNAHSRISLSEDRDPFGLPKIKVDWQLSQFDKHSIIEATHRIAEELGRLQLGRIELAEWLTDDDNTWPQPLWGGCHHMGTTRMTDDTRTGVVDRNCRLHTVTNTYVVGSSVFPTAGYVPPTLTIVALALRLADHLKQAFRPA